MAGSPEEVTKKLEQLEEKTPVEKKEDPKGEESEPREVTEESVVEKEARRAGWKPKDDFDGDPDEWVTARQFVRNGEYLKKIHNSNRKIKKLEDTIGALANQHKKIFDAGYEKAKRELKSQYRQALKEGDDSVAEQVEEQLDALDKKYKEEVKTYDVAKPDPAQNNVHPDFANWVKDNDWFIKEPTMRAHAEIVGVAYAQENEGISNVEVYDYVTKEMKKRYPEKFPTTEHKRERPNTVEQDTPVRRRGNQGRIELSDEQMTVGRTLVKQKVYKNIEEYTTELKKSGVLG